MTTEILSLCFLTSIMSEVLNHLSHIKTGSYGHDDYILKNVP